MKPSGDVLLLTLSGDVYVKSPRTRQRFRDVITDNLRAALRSGVGVTVDRLDAGRLLVSGEELGEVAEAAIRTFGVQRVEYARPLHFGSLEDLAVQVAATARDRIAGRTFAVRVRRHGRHSWGSLDAERRIGTLLLADSAGVDLDDPQVTVGVVVFDDTAWAVERSWDGPGGLPLGTQERCLALLSGGFDSPVAAWMLMRRGSPVDFLHLQLDCAQADHALAVAHHLWRRWGAGTSPVVWVVDFAAVQEALRTQVPPRLRQVVLKQLMFAAADRVAADLDVPAIVTGEAVGQVSSQTLRHLAEIDRMCERTVLRPLAGLDKQEIIARARDVGTEALSARAKEVCDLSAGERVAVAARRPTLVRAHEALPEGLVADAVAARRAVALEHWLPGMEIVAVREGTADAVVVGPGDPLPPSGPVAFAGAGAVHRATRLRATGREASVVVGDPTPRPTRRAAAVG